MSPTGDPFEPVAVPRSLLEGELLLASAMRTLPLAQRAFAHDLRTPLNALQLSLELLATTLPEAPESAPEAPWARHVRIMRDELARLTRMLHEAAEQTPVLPDAREPLDLRALAAEVTGLLRGQATRQRVQLTAELGEAPLIVTGARERLRQAVLNVAFHAMENIAGSGRLRMALEPGDAMCVLSVGHDGAPLAPQLEPSARMGGSAPPSVGGLWAASLVAESHGGSLRAVRAGELEVLEFMLPRS